MKRTLILGGPGTGKTRGLIDIVEGLIESGVRPDRIAFVSFTRAAAYEARDKAVSRFRLSQDALPWFRTLHSLCFRILDLSCDQVFRQKHRDEFAELVGESAKEDEPLMALSIRSRTTFRGLVGEWEESPSDVGWFSLERFHAAYEGYRRDRAVLDFTDMLQFYLDSDVGPCPVEVAVVDEAQDLSALQWLVVEKAFADCREVYYAGDDDQAIYNFAGADRERFLNLSCDELRVLPVSHRLPEPVFDLAQEVGSRISQRYRKDVTSAGKPGELEWVARPDHVDLSSGSWLLLSRTRRQMEVLAKVARDQGVVHTVGGEPTVDADSVLGIKAYEALRHGSAMPADDVQRALACLGVKRKLDDGRSYTAVDLGLDVGPIWHDALIAITLREREYYLACLRRGEKLDAEPRVRVDTIHGSKGKESDHVLLMTDLTRMIYDGQRRDPDSEWRVWYVGVTRASSTLHLIQSRAPHRIRL